MDCGKFIIKTKLTDHNSRKRKMKGNIGHEVVHSSNVINSNRNNKNNIKTIKENKNININNGNSSNNNNQNFQSKNY